MSGMKPKLTESLSPYLDKTLQSYQSFLDQTNPTDAKGFTAYHNACKAVLSHLALLMKLMDEPVTAEPQQQSLLDWINKAKNAPELQEETDDDFE